MLFVRCWFPIFIGILRSKGVLIGQRPNNNKQNEKMKNKIAATLLAIVLPCVWSSPAQVFPIFN
jgi:hypothetical protein